MLSKCRVMESENRMRVRGVRQRRGKNGRKERGRKTEQGRDKDRVMEGERQRGGGG